MRPSEGESSASLRSVKLTWPQEEFSVRRSPRRSCGRRPVGVAQHGVEGAGEVVGERAAVILLGQRNQAGQDQQQQEEDVEGEGSAENPVEERPSRGRVPPVLPEPTRGERDGFTRSSSTIHLLKISEGLKIGKNQQSSFNPFKSPVLNLWALTPMGVRR